MKNEILNQEALMVDLEQWELFGGGATGLSYNHRQDDSIVLKLNKATRSKEETLREYQISKSLCEAGINCPKVLDFVTDGERYGYTMEKVKDKKSFSRLVADNPVQLESIARKFAREARSLHQIKLDRNLFPSFKENYLADLSGCEVLSESDKRILTEALDKLDDDCFCIHGDMNPCNIISSHGRNYWIDMGDVAYGDPDIDFADLLFTCENVPPAVIKFIFHISKEQFIELKEYCGQEYYGERWGTEELNGKLHNALLVRVGRTVINNPRTAPFYCPFIRGQRLRHRLMIAIMNLIVRKV